MKEGPRAPPDRVGPRREYWGERRRPHNWGRAGRPRKVASADLGQSPCRQSTGSRRWGAVSDVARPETNAVADRWPPLLGGEPYIFAFADRAGGP
jgi:hypothetical protein